MRKLLWVGDAAVSTGFARCTHHILAEACKTWEVYVLGINYQGDPHEFPYPIFPCWPGGDAFGTGRLKSLIDGIHPDLIVLQNDPWNIPAYLETIPEDIPVVASMPVDGKNFRAKGLDRLALAVFWTSFGLDEARHAGYQGRASVIPLGVDTERYKVRDKKAARKALGLPDYLQDAYIVGNVNRNQPRKRLDLTVAYFAEWIRTYNLEDAWLYLHVAPTGEDQEYDLVQLMGYYGLRGDNKRMIFSEPHIGHGVSEEELAHVYASFDAQLTTTQGEGWGLTTMEGMACGIPQIVPQWAALDEWTEEAALGIECTGVSVTPQKINVIGGVVDRVQTIQALQTMYLDDKLRAGLAEEGLALTARPEYRWASIAQKYVDAFDTIPLPSLRNEGKIEKFA